MIRYYTLILILLCDFSVVFVTPCASKFRYNSLIRLQSKPDSSSDDDTDDTSSSSPSPSDLTKVGSKEYYGGFLSSPLKPDATDADSDQFRQEGLEQAIKLAGGSTVFIGAAFLAFMRSNGLI